MKQSFLSVFMCMITLTHYHGKADKEIAFSSSCPERPSINFRGPPGIPGKLGKNLQKRKININKKAEEINSN